MRRTDQPVNAKVPVDAISVLAKLVFIHVGRADQVDTYKV